MNTIWLDSTDDVIIGPGKTVHSCTDKEPSTDSDNPVTNGTVRFILIIFESAVMQQRDARIQTTMCDTALRNPQQTPSACIVTWLAPVVQAGQLLLFHKRSHCGFC